MSNRITSNRPFSNKCNLRAGTGPVYNKFCPPSNTSTGGGRTTKIIKEPCFGPYDNVVNYVYQIDTSNGNHLAYVDCDYVE